jgi:hypothetical protein
VSENVWSEPLRRIGSNTTSNSVINQRLLHRLKLAMHQSEDADELGRFNGKYYDSCRHNFAERTSLP